MKKVLILEDNPDITGEIKEILGEEYEVKEAKNATEAIDFLQTWLPDIIIQDCDVKGEDSFDVFKRLKSINPYINILMISSTSEIRTAVTAAKMGVSDFLRKPLTAQRFKESVEKTLSTEEILPFKVAALEGAEWLSGGSSVLSEFLKNLEAAARSDLDSILIGERGIPKDIVAELIHKSGRSRNKKYVFLDLISFSKEATEQHFWTTFIELLEARMDLLEEETVGTIHLLRFEVLPKHFQISILQFLNKRKKEFLANLDKSIKLIISTDKEEDIQNFERVELLSPFFKLIIPPLRERMEDLPILIDSYLNKFSKIYAKVVRGVSTNLLPLMSLYGWPGNYVELENLLLGATLSTKGEIITLHDFQIDSGFVTDTILKKFFSQRILMLEDVRENFEKEVLGLVLEKVGWDESRAATFLDIPKTILQERMKKFGIKPFLKR